MRWLSYFMPKMSWTLVYMLQQVEYNPTKFLKWTLTFPNLLHVQKRGRLETTARVKLMLVIAYTTCLVAIFMIALLALRQDAPVLFMNLLLVPLFCIVAIYISTLLLQSLIINPKQSREILSAKQKITNSKALRIAVLGSYGKTTMKELLVTVLSEGKKVVATPGNKNVLISHARWVNNATMGDEDVLVFEYGEAEPGDIARLAAFSKPDMAVVTGIAPAHMDSYPNPEAVAQDFATISDTVKPGNIYFNDAETLMSKINGISYSAAGMGVWRVKNVKVAFDGTKFELKKDKEALKLHTGLLGTHQIGPLVAVVTIAKKLGLSNEQIISGVAKTKPFEHRMQPRQLHGAWIIDDTYNGNIEGMRAGLNLLKTLSGKRKIYVTPGLVDQGVETEWVHTELGVLIAKANPDKVVLMQNSVTAFIRTGLKQEDYHGEIVVETNPLEYYTNLEHFLANGDVVMLQNDWPDSYK